MAFLWLSITPSFCDRTIQYAKYKPYGSGRETCNPLFSLKVENLDTEPNSFFSTLLMKSLDYRELSLLFSNRILIHRMGFITCLRRIYTYFWGRHSFIGQILSNLDLYLSTYTKIPSLFTFVLCVVVFQWYVSF